MDATASRPPDQGYSKLHFIPEFAHAKKTYLPISYDKLLENPKREILRITKFCGLSEINPRIDDAAGFIRRMDMHKYGAFYLA